MQLEHVTGKQIEMLSNRGSRLPVPVYPLHTYSTSHTISCLSQASRTQTIPRKAIVVAKYLWISESPQRFDGRWPLLEKRCPSWKEMVRQRVISSKSFALSEKPGRRFSLMGVHQGVSKGLGNVEKVICLCLLATSTQTGSLHGIDSIA